MIPEIIDRDECIVMGVRGLVSAGIEGSAAIWRDCFLPRHGEIGGIDKRYFGVFSAVSGAGSDDRYEYVAGMVVNSLDSIPTGMTVWVVPAGRYAECPATGQLGIAEVCREMILDWLPDSGYRLAASPLFAYTDSARPDLPDAVWKVNIPVGNPEDMACLDSWLKGSGNATQCHFM